MRSPRWAGSTGQDYSRSAQVVVDCRATPATAPIVSERLSDPFRHSGARKRRVPARAAGTLVEGRGSSRQFSVWPTQATYRSEGPDLALADVHTRTDASSFERERDLADTRPADSDQLL